MARTTFADLGYRPKRVRILLLESEWRALEEETDRRAMPLGATISTLLGLVMANRDAGDTITSQARRDAAARSSSTAVPTL